ncbi:MAG: ATP-binding protein [Lachnospiraceae bacterium]|nr:ATP-binding protein [Lachnospiraceae bacterium]
MLIQFNFKNFKSFREEATLDLSAAKMTEFSDRVVTIGSEKILPVAAIYGANASGKSNIYNAFEYMSHYVAESFRYGGEEEEFEQFRPTPFLFDSTSEEAESSFEVYFTLPGDKAEKTYNYGFCINKEGVTEEWLNVKAKTARKYNTVFYRGTSDEELDLSGFPKNSRDNIQVALEKQVLIISLGAKLKIGKCKDIRDWFLANEFADFGDPVTNFFLSRRLPKGFVEDKNVQQKVVEYFASFDEHIRDFRVEKVPGDGDSKDESFKINALHKKIDSDEMAEIPLSLESAGTLKMFALYPELQEVLEKGSVFFIDELNARLHPLLVRNFLLTFLNPEINKNHAQLIFTTHDTWQLSNQLLRRDEIWFVEKDERGVSSLYSLADFVDEDGVRIRKDESYEKNYMVGKYGAIPMLKTLDIFKDALVQVSEGTGLSPQKKED